MIAVINSNKVVEVIFDPVEMLKKISEENHPYSLNEAESGILKVIDTTVYPTENVYYLPDEKKYSIKVSSDKKVAELSYDLSLNESGVESVDNTFLSMFNSQYEKISPFDITDLICTITPLAKEYIETEIDSNKSMENLLKRAKVAGNLPKSIADSSDIGAFSLFILDLNDTCSSLMDIASSVKVSFLAKIQAENYNTDFFDKDLASSSSEFEIQVNDLLK